jgi:hypothetical protein
MKKSRTATPRLLLRKERIRILAQSDFRVVDGGEGSTGSKETGLITGNEDTANLPPPTTCG